MRYLVTGAGGFLGSYCTRFLVERGEDVVALVKPTTNLWRLNGIEVPLVYEPVKADTILHFAWQDYPIHDLMDCLNLFPCRCFVGIGSQAEFGPTPYGATKVNVRLLTSKLAELSGARHIWLRFLTVYGPKDNPEHLIPHTIQELLAHRRPALTDGKEEWDYLYVEDAVEAIFRAAEGPSGVYNIGSGKLYSVMAIAEHIRNMINPSLHLGYGEYKSEKKMYLQADTIVGHTSITDGLRKTIEWHESI